MRRHKLALCLSVVACTILFAGTVLADSIIPVSINATLNPGECKNELKTVTLTGSPASVDIMFSFDLTGSMIGITDTAKVKAIEIMSAVQAALPASAIRFGVGAYGAHIDKKLSM